jgi:cell division protein FtsL
MRTATLVSAALAVTVFVTALACVWAVHANRVSFSRLQALEAERDEMNIDWGRLQIEQAAWSTHARIERVARERLQMRIPEPHEVVIVTR